MLISVFLQNYQIRIFGAFHSFKVWGTSQMCNHVNKAKGATKGKCWENCAEDIQIHVFLSHSTEVSAHIFSFNYFTLPKWNETERNGPWHVCSLFTLCYCWHKYQRDFHPNFQKWEKRNANHTFRIVFFSSRSSFIHCGCFYVHQNNRFCNVFLSYLQHYSILHAIYINLNMIRQVENWNDVLTVTSTLSQQSEKDILCVAIGVRRA